jgi:signal transduction histidine kinase
MVGCGFPLSPSVTSSAINQTTIEYLILIGISIVLFSLLHAVFWRRLPHRFGMIVGWLMLALILGSGWTLVHKRVADEGARLEGILIGYPAMYAFETERLNHAQITLETSANDPTYLNLIDLQKKWLKSNPSILDIYTLRRASQPDELTLIVDSETDYDGNGRYESEREARTSIGETYRHIDMTECFKCFETGKPIFETSDERKDNTDRWGTFVAAYAPLMNADGKVEAVLGVDFDRDLWFGALRAARIMSMRNTALFVLGLCAILSFVTIATVASENRLRRVETARATEARTRLESLIDTIDGVLYEWDPSEQKFRFVSGHVTNLLGYPTSLFIDNSEFWKSKVDRSLIPMILQHRALLAEGKESVPVSYPMRAASGRIVWLRESGKVVRNETETFIRGIMLDVTRLKEADDSLERLNQQLLDASRQAGMAEVATGVLHNVGNVLNTVNVAGNLMHDRLRTSRLPSLSKLANLLPREENRLAEFLTHDERGRLVPSYLDQLAIQLHDEHTSLRSELDQMIRSIDHIREIVITQQKSAITGGTRDTVDLRILIDDAIALTRDGFSQDGVRLETICSRVPAVTTDRHRVLQILVNLLRNARQATAGNAAHERHVTVTARPAEDDLDAIELTIADNGVGIAPECLTRIFAHGYTTRSDGHGFGLHTSALAAKAVGGSLSVVSAGIGRGASFILRLPSHSPAPTTLLAHGLS